MNRKIKIAIGMASAGFGWVVLAGNPSHDATIPASGVYAGPTVNLGHVVIGSKLNGMDVKNFQDEKLGDVDNLVIDLEHGRILAIVVSTGGFLGIGDELSAVPPEAFRYNKTRDALLLNTTREKLAQSPHFNAKQWPDIGEPSYADRIYSAFGIAPYFGTNGEIAADNTGRNARDRDAHSLTPLDQGESESDVATSIRIRKEIMAMKDMSLNAHNVKIITVNGRVTLRGPVETDGEKRAIGDIASRATAQELVDNQLEVK